MVLVSDEDLLLDPREGRAHIDSAIDRLKSSEEETDTRNAVEDDFGCEGADVSPCPGCGAAFASLSETLDHVRDVHGLDV